jgi:dipeptidyl aminopeptidase/acylaminoacyl peptidase
MPFVHRIRHCRPWLVSLTIAAAGCGGDDGGTTPNPDPPSVSSVTLSVTNDTILVSSTLRLIATLRDSAGNELGGRAITWATSDPSLASVSTSGDVSALALGTVTIGATSEGKTASAVLTLAPLVTVSRRLPTAFAGDTTLLTATLTDANGEPLAGAVAEWTSSDEGVATVTPQGVVTAGSTGTATITATSSGGRGSADMVVLEYSPRANREIAYVRNALGSHGFSIDELRALQPDGSGSQPISPPDEYVSQFHWSPTGDQVAVIYVSTNDIGKTGLYVLNADGTGERPVAANGGAYPRWSPDGQRIAFRTHGPARIWTVNADGTDPLELTSLTGDQIDPEWSPDGRQIGFRRQDTFCDELWLMDADGTHEREVDLPVGMCNLAWSPDGKLIAFASPSADGQRAGIWLVNSDGSDPRPFTPNCSATGVCGGDRDYFGPKWSPDGEHLAYMSAGIAGDLPSVHVSDLDRTDVIEFAVGNPLEASVDWSPDGTRLVFPSRKEASPQWPSIVVSEANGTGQVTISGDENAGEPAWRR